MASGTRKAVDAAEQLLAQVGVDAPPTPVDRMAAALGVQIVYKSFQGDTSGLLIHRPNGRKTIGVNTFHSATRQRFTIAHELGHAILHLKNAPLDRPEVVIDKPREMLFRDRRSSAATDRREIEANAFAAELLMPGSMIEKAFRQHLSRSPSDSTESLVKSLATLFRVSPQAMSYRLVNLDLIDPA